MGKEIQERLTIAVNDGVAYVIIDFSLSALVSAAILRIIIDTANQIQRHRGCIVITGANRSLRSLLLISDVLKLGARIYIDSRGAGPSAYRHGQ